MKWILFFLLICTLVKADEIQTNEHELFLTAYLQSFHFTKNSSTGEDFNDVHKAYGLEYIYRNHYSLTYNHFINSRGNDIDAYAAGYLLHFNDSFGLHLTGGYQEGYCFDGFLSSVNCTEGKSDKSAFVLPLLYYKHEYFKIDFFTNSDMIAFRLNIKIYDLF